MPTAGGTVGQSAVLIPQDAQAAHEGESDGGAAVVGLVVADTVLVILLGLLVVGLLRSHADIARALRDLGAPIGDPSPAAGRRPTDRHTSPVELRRSEDGAVVQMGPAVPPRAVGTATFDVDGTTPFGDALAISVAGGGLTLLAFLTSGCQSCAHFWQAIDEDASPLPHGIRTVIVTKGPEAEHLAAVQRLAGSDSRVPVVMSTDAWSDYEVPGSPFFVLVDGTGEMSRRVGEGAARSMAEVAQLVTAATEDRSLALAARRAPTATPPAPPRGHRDHVPTVDEELAAAGIRPGDPSLFPRTMDDLIRGRRARSEQ